MDTLILSVMISITSTLMGVGSLKDLYTLLGVTFSVRDRLKLRWNDGCSVVEVDDSVIRLKLQICPDSNALKSAGNRAFSSCSICTNKFKTLIQQMIVGVTASNSQSYSSFM